MTKRKRPRKRTKAQREETRILRATRKMVKEIESCRRIPAAHGCVACDYGRVIPCLLQ